MDTHGEHVIRRATHDRAVVGRDRAAPLLTAGDSRVPLLAWRVFALIWLAFLVYPLRGLLHNSLSLVHRSGTLAGTALLIGLYLALIWPRPFADEAPLSPRRRAGPALLALLGAVILLLTLTESLDWLWFLILVGIAAGASLPARPAALAVLATTALAVVAGREADGWLLASRIGLPVGVVGLGVIGVGQLARTNRELRAAREEIARLAVAEERLRFARDLHDLLGHSLSTVTLKSELARALVQRDPDRAEREIEEAIALARETLREVRQAVSGYRQPTLTGELAGAREMLEAAGIACRQEVSVAGLPAETDAVLGWVIREGTTNVVRHSRARQCTIRVTENAGMVVAEIADDGAVAGAGIAGTSGNGLQGLAERVAGRHGHLKAGPDPTGGFRLCVTIPSVEPVCNAGAGPAPLDRES